MSGNISIKHKSMYVHIYGVAGLSAVFLMQGLWSQWDSGAAGWSGLVGLMMAGILWWVELVRSGDRVDLDVGQKRLILQKRTVLLVTKVSEYSIDRFSGVRSYITPGRTPSNIVELVTKQGGEGVVVAYMEPGKAAESFFSVSAGCENMEAYLLRKQIAEKAGLVDLGYVGKRMIGAQLGR